MLRFQDVVAHKKLIVRGHEELTFNDPDAWWAVGHKPRERMVGRIYTRAMVQRAEAIALKYADTEQRARFANLNSE